VEGRQFQFKKKCFIFTGNLLTYPDLRDYASPVIDEICAALFENDSVFYRAKVLEVTENGRKVFFIDYGNIATATKFKELPDAMKTMRPLVFHCQLVDGENLNQSQKEKIEDALFETDAHFEMEIIDETVEPKMIKLYKSQVELFQQLGIKPEKDRAKNGTNADVPSGMPPKNKFKSTEVLKELKRSKK
jgi:Tudor domain